MGVRQQVARVCLRQLSLVHLVSYSALSLSVNESYLVNEAVNL